MVKFQLAILILAISGQPLASPATNPIPSAGAALQNGPAAGPPNLVALRSLLRELYTKYDTGKATIPEVFSIAARFKIEPDGSLSGMRLTKSSGSADVDKDAISVLRALSDSRILTPLSQLTSTAARLDVGKQSVSFAASGLATDAAEAQRTAGMLKSLLALFRASQGARNPAAAELLALATATSQDRKVALELAGTKSRFNELFNAGTGQTPR
ncbi:MAG TPA: TonB C-terminal domain-containing protein [Blastocatellia bacterium]|nr:TonB C-terminal domain-containing protein [Blastocatellia bacterium]